MNKYTIEFNEEHMDIKLEEPEPFDKLISIQLQALHMTIEDLFKQNPDADKLRPDLFDLMNTAFTNILHMIDPNSQQNPNLTEVAILLAENQLIKGAIRQGMTIEEYLPIQKKELEKDLKILKMNTEGRQAQKRKQRNALS